MTVRAQSTVVGVAILLAITVTSMAVLTAGVGSVVDDAASTARADHVADRFVTLLPDSGASGDRVGELRVGRGVVDTVDREIRLVRAGDIVFERAVNALVYEHRGARVVAHAGAVITGTGEDARFRDLPDAALTEGGAGRTAYVALPVFSTGSGDGLGTGARFDLAVSTTTTTLTLSGGSYRIAVETSSPTPWTRWFHKQRLETGRDDFDGDGIPSVVATIPDTRAVHVVVIDTEVRTRG